MHVPIFPLSRCLSQPPKLCLLEDLATVLSEGTADALCPLSLESLPEDLVPPVVDRRVLVTYSELELEETDLVGDVVFGKGRLRLSLS